MNEYFLFRLNGEFLNCVTGANIDFNIEQDLVISANVTLTVEDEEVPANSELKIYHVLNEIETLVGTFLISTPTETRYKHFTDVDVDCYSTLLLLTKRKLEQRYTCKKGTQVTNEVIRLINALGLAYTLDIELSEKATSTDIDFEIGTTYLEVINTLLAVINYTRIYPRRDGNYESIPYITPTERKATVFYNENNKDNILLPHIAIENDFYNTDNVYIRYIDDADVQLVATYENSNVDSVVSTFNAPRSVNAQEVRDVADLETLYEIAKRDCLNDLNQYYTGSLTTAIDSNLWYSDIIEVVLNGINDKFECTGWSFECTGGADMQVNIRKVVRV